MLTHVDNRITYSGNGNATEFAYQFKILDRTDIKVLLTDADGKEKLLTKDYYVDVEKNVVRYPGYAVGAEVPESERPPVLPAGWKLTIYREVPVTQETDLPDQYPFNQVEDIGDKLTMIAQQLTDVTSRSLKISVSKSADIDATIPWENGKSFRISDDGAKVELTEDPARVLPLAQGVYAQTKEQAEFAKEQADASSEAASAAKTSETNAKNYSENVNVFIPSVSDSGVLSWTNKAGLPNPASVNIKGDTGAQGLKGDTGNAATIEIGTVTTGEAGSSASVTNSGTASNVVLNFTLPRGKDGKDGGVTVDAALFATSTNPVQNKVIKAALDGKLGKNETAARATQDGAGNNIVDTYAKKIDISGVVKSVNGTAPDTNGNVEVSGGLPVGHEFFTTNPNIPAGCIPLLGGEYSRTAYADLWAWVQTQAGYLIEESAWQAKAADNGGNVPFYSKGDGSTTFRVPALKCWVRGAGGISEVGGYLPAGLPNITGSTAWAVNGTIGTYATQDTPYHRDAGALSVKKDGKAYGAIGDTGEDSAKSNVSVNIDASLSNPIYGSSDTVQPPSIVGMWLVKAYGTVTNVGSTDVANISTGLTQAETRISSLETNKVDKVGNAWVVESYRNGTEWYRVWSDGWVEQGGDYNTVTDIGTITITLPKPMADTNYNVLVSKTSFGGGSGLPHVSPTITSKTTTKFVVTIGYSYQVGKCCFTWRVYGKGA